MPIKELIERYEQSSPSQVNVLRNQVAASAPGARVGDTVAGSSSNDELLTEVSAEASKTVEAPQRLARFVKHSRPPHEEDHFVEQSALSIQSTNLTTFTTANDGDATLKQSYLSPNASSHVPSSFISPFNDSSRTLASLYDNEGRGVTPTTYSYPPNVLRQQEQHEKQHGSDHPPHHPYHYPVPATTVFSRDAFPLSLPKLDHYLASLPPPYLGNEGDTNGSGMFPPLDQLAKTKRSIEDLENNAVVPPTWRNLTSLLNSSQNFFISLLVYYLSLFLLLRLMKRK